MSSSINSKSLISSYLILNITTGIVGGAMQLVVPLFAMDLHASSMEIGVIRGISGVGMLLLVIPAGFMVDHFGSKRLFLCGALAGTCFTLALSLAGAPSGPDLPHGAGRALQCPEDDRPQCLFLPQPAGDGAGEGRLVQGVDVDRPHLPRTGLRRLPRRPGDPFPIIFRLLAALTLIPAALVFIFHNDPIRHEAAGAFRENIRAQLQSFGQLVRRRTLYLPLLTESLSTGCFATFSTFIIVIAVQTLHLPATTASLLLTTEGGIFILTVFAAGPLITRLSSLQLYLLGVGVTIAALAGFPLVDGFAALLGVTVVLGLGLGLLNLVTSSSLGRMEGEKGKIVGLFAAAVGVGISLGPMLGGVVAQYLGTSWIFPAFIVPFALLAGVAWHEAHVQEEPFPNGVPEDSY